MWLYFDTIYKTYLLIHDIHLLFFQTLNVLLQLVHGLLCELFPAHFTRCIHNNLVRDGLILRIHFFPFFLERRQQLASESTTYVTCQREMKEERILVNELMAMLATSSRSGSDKSRMLPLRRVSSCSWAVRTIWYSRST
jgi:hypothetical protein